MAGGLSAQITTIFAKAESTYKTDPTPVAADAMLVSNVTVSPYQGNNVSRDFLRSYYGSSSEINVGAHVHVTFDVEIAGSGAIATEPAWGRLLKACNFDVTIASPTVQHSYSPVSTAPSSQNSVTIYAELNGETQVIVGCRGNVSMNFSAGTIPKFTFTFLGIFARPTASSITPNFTAFQAPVPVTDANTGTLTVDSYAFLVESLTLDVGNTLAYRNVVNGEAVVIGDRKTRGSITFEHELIADKNVWSLFESHESVTTAVLDMVHNLGTGSPINNGYIIELDAPAVQLSNPQYGESDSIRTMTCDLVFTPSSGNDEITLIAR